MASAVDFGNGEKNSLDKSETTDHTPNGNNDLSHQETAQTVLTADKTQPDAHQLSTYLEGGAAAALSQEHRDYLLQRHGTLDLDPMPSDDPADPYNWPTWKKTSNLFLVAFHGMMTTFVAAGPIPAYEDVSLDLGVSLTKASYLTSVQIAFLGVAPLIWKPFSSRYGRRPMWMLSVLGSGLFNVGCALSQTYGAMVVCRCFAAAFLSPGMALGSGVVVETFFKKDRGRFMGIWTLMMTLGPPVGPFIMGFVAERVDYRWIYWICAIVNAAQFVAYFFFGPETRYIRQGVDHGKGSAFRREYLNFRRIDPKPLSFYEFVQPLALARYTSILIPSTSYAIVFGFCSVFLTVEIPQIFIPKFGFNPQQIGLQFLGIIIGSVIGEQLAGPLSDWWMKRKTRSLPGDERAPPEHRLWVSYFGYLLTIVGIIVFGVRIQQAPHGQWNVTPIIGIAISAVGNQIVTTVCMTYAVDCHNEHSSSVGVFVNFVRSTWSFIGPFWFPKMIESLGDSGSAGLMAGIIFLFSWIPMIILQYRGTKSRHAQAEKEEVNTGAVNSRGD